LATKFNFKGGRFYNQGGWKSLNQGARDRKGRERRSRNKMLI